MDSRMRASGNVKFDELRGSSSASRGAQQDFMMHLARPVCKPSVGFQ
jgi:hypothetical protein